MQVSQSRLIDLLVAMGVSTAPDWPDTPGKLASKVNNKDGGIAKYSDPAAAYNGDPELLALYNSLAAAQEGGELIEPVDEVGGSDLPTDSGTGDANSLPGKAAEISVVPKTEVTETHETPSVTAPAVSTAPRRTRPNPKAAARGKAAPEKAPAKKGRRAGSNGRPKPGAPYGEQLAYFRKHPMKVTDRGTGIMRIVVRELKAAGKGAKPKPVTKQDILEVLKREFPDRDVIKMMTNINNLVPGRLERFYGINVWRARVDKSTKMSYYIKGDGSTPQPKSERPRTLRGKAAKV